MTDAPYKILLFLKRRPGMSVEEFRAYYETHHVRFGEGARGIARYVRRYLQPLPNPETGEAGELPFDVITELWFDDRSIFEATVKRLSTEILPAEVIEDEERLFDRAATRMATLVECDSPVGGS